MTVEVQTPQGVKTGYAVREVVSTRPPPLPALGESRGSTSVRGEAVAVDLPDGQTLFALLTSEGGDVDYAAHVPGKKLGFAKGSTRVEGPVTIWPHPPVQQGTEWRYAFPMLVRFKDIADPKSVERVDKANLAASFGTGYALRRITVEKTGEPVTVGIVKRLAWLSEFPEPRLDGDYKGSTNPNLAEKLTHGAFRRD